MGDFFSSVVNLFLQEALIETNQTLSIFRIQDSDGGFFEKFGSLLRHKSLQIEENVSPLAPLHEELFIPELSLRTIEEQANDSGTETLQDTDSEPDDLQAKSEEILEDRTGWNVSVNFNSPFTSHSYRNIYCLHIELMCLSFLNCKQRY